MNSIKNKICLITGATSGIGKATAFALAKKGMTIIIVGHNERKCEKTVQAIIRSTQNASIDYLVADLSPIEDIRKLCDKFKSRYNRLDVLVNNAGARFDNRQVSVDGDVISPAKGAATSIYLATSPEVQGVSGKYFTNCKPIKSSNVSYDKEMAKRLWDVSLELTGLNE